MIIKAKSISHIEKSIAYIHQHEKEHEFIDSAYLDISSDYTICRDMSFFESPRYKNNYVSLVISPNQNDNLNNEDLQRILHLTLEKLNLTNRPYYAVKHKAGEGEDLANHDHIHIYLTRFNLEGEAWEDGYSFWKCLEASKEITDELGLTPNDVNLDNDKSSVIRSPFHMNRNEAMKDLRSIVKQNLYKVISIDEMYDHLEAKGATVNIKTLKNGLIGVSIDYKDFTYKASDVSKFLSLRPDGNTYKANPKMEFVIARNEARMTENRDSNEILKEITEYTEYGYQKSYLTNEMEAFKLALLDIRDRRNQEWEEELALRRQRKHSKKHRQIGFKVQI